jgi:hypothetical protein
MTRAKTEFKIFYFAGRYTLLGALIGVGVALDVTTSVSTRWLRMSLTILAGH